MIQKKFLRLPISGIIVSDSPFFIPSLEPLEALTLSLQKLGQLTPVYVQSYKQSYRLVTGFKRLDALKQTSMEYIDCYLLSQTISDLALFEFVLEENRVQRDFNVIEISHILARLSETYKLPRRSIIDNYLPLLGLGRREKLYQVYISLRKLPLAWKRALIEDVVSPELAWKMSKAEEESRALFLDMVFILRLNKKLQKEFWHLLRDIASSKACRIGEIIQQTDFQNILHHIKLTPQQKASKVKDHLIRLRYPQYSQVQDRLDGLLKKFKLPPTVRIQPSPFLSDDIFHFYFRAKTTEEYIEHLDRLNHLAEKEKIDQLFELVK
ncbi:hypothetical protein GF407_18250 [candidate division KSB1 bacterium]|nr:hypothetical protein [candidate division KSB1 bacterium]